MTLIIFPYKLKLELFVPLRFLSHLSQVQEPVLCVCGTVKLLLENLYSTFWHSFSLGLFLNSYFHTTQRVVFFQNALPREYGVSRVNGDLIINN